MLLASYCMAQQALSLGAVSLPKSDWASWAIWRTLWAKGMLYNQDTTSCEQACATENGLPPDDDKIAAQQVTSAHKYTTVLNIQDKYMRKLCTVRTGPIRVLSRWRQKTALTGHDKSQVHGMPLLHEQPVLSALQAIESESSPCAQVHYVRQSAFQQENGVCEICTTQPSLAIVSKLQEARKRRSRQSPNKYLPVLLKRS